MMRLAYIVAGITLPLILSAAASGVERFPPPEFETPHPLPQTTVPVPRQNIYEYLDIAVLLAALALSAHLVLKKRSRRGIFALMLFSLIYFGFWRKGCVCSIGAIQNIILAIFDSSYVVPVGAIAFFVLPLVFSLFFARTFCAAVCPLGAIQDLVLLRPVPVPKWLENGLRLFAYVYLASAVLFAATGSAFIICRYDPFIAFFRLSGSLNILILGACFLLIGVFVGRPYCRFVCPYGVILRQLSRVSKWKVTITPDECINCRLCEDSCPFGAIKTPIAQWSPRDYIKNKKILAFLILLMPILTLLGSWAAASISGPVSRLHATVRLAERIYMEDTGKAEGTTDASTAFRATGEDTKQLYDQASVIRSNFTLGGWFLGAFVGLVAALKLVGLSVRRQRTDYEADRAGCLACGRCFKYCPRERVRLNSIKEVSDKST